MNDPLLLAMLSNTVVASLVGGIGWLFYRRRPSVAHALFALALVKLMTPPLLSVELTFGSLQERHASGQVTVALAPSEQRAESAALPATHAAAPIAAPASLASAPHTRPDAPHLPARASHWGFEQTVLCLWGIGSLMVASLLLHRSRQLTHLISQTHPADPTTIAEVEQARVAMGLSKAPRAQAVTAPIPPMVVLHRLRPVLLAPSRALHQLSPQARTALWMHELAHVARGDIWLRLLEAAACVLLWWHPLRWLLQRALRDAEERACDALATSSASPSERRSYCNALLTAATATPPAMANLASPATRSPSHSPQPRHQRAWKRRLENVMTNSHPARANRITRVAIAAIAALSLPIAIAQEPAPEREPVQQRLERIEIATNFVEAPLEDWASYLAKLCELNVVIDESAAALDPERTTLVGLKLPRTSVRRVLDVIRALTDLHWQCEGDNVLRLSATATPQATTAANRQVRVHGAIAKPGLMTLRKDETLLEVVTRITTLQAADLGAVRLTRLDRKQPLQVVVDIDSMLRTGTTAANYRLRDGDILTIPDKPPADLPPLTLRPGSSVRFVLDGTTAGLPGLAKLALLEQPQRVQRDGTIFVPYVGNIAVLGMDRDQTATAVKDALQRVVSHPVQMWARFD